MEIILASQSPRRRELLTLMGLEFRVRAADVDEAMDPSLPPQQEVARVSALKAKAVEAPADALVIAADTVVVCDGQILGKPATGKAAAEMLELLSGKAHQVMTGYTLRLGERLETHTEISTIYFRELSPEEIGAYVATGEPMDKAGAYGIQGKAALFVKGLEGDYYNVMGLPVCALGQSLRRFGVALMGV